MGILQKLSHYGPGGRNCVCCGPSPTNRKKHDRAIKRRERHHARKAMMDALREMEEESHDNLVTEMREEAMELEYEDYLAEQREQQEQDEPYYVIDDIDPFWDDY